MVDKIVKLYREKSELALLEIAYAILTVLSFILAAVLSLFNHALGTGVLVVPLISLTAGIMNIVAWSLIKLVADHFTATEKAKKSAEKPTKTTKSAKK